MSASEDASKQLRVAVVAPPWFTIPPDGYGGIEAMVHWLVQGLVARGHHVTLIGAGDCRTSAQGFLQTYEEPPVADLGTPFPEIVHALKVDEHLRFEPSHGHTPGHSCVRLTTKAGEAVFSGDLMHRVVQVAEPQWSSIFCYDARQAAATRKAFVERHAASGELVLPAHFPHPGRIVRGDGGHRFEPVMLDPIAVPA